MSDILERLDKLKTRIQEDDFLKGNGLSNEVNIHIFCYDPADEMAVRYFTEQLISDQSLTSHVIEKNLYKVLLEICDEKRITKAAASMEENLNLQGSITSIYTLTMLVALIFTILFVIGRLGKRNTIIVGSVIAAVGYFLPILTNTPVMLHVGEALRGIGFGISSVPVGSILQDALTYGLWRDGFSAVGMGNAAASFGNKLGTALGTVILGWALELGGYVSSATSQSISAVKSITFMYAVFPALLCAGMFILALIYDLDGEKYSKIEKDIKEGRIGENKFRE